MLKCPNRIIYRVPVLRETTYEQIQALLEDAVLLKAAVVLMFHSIGDNGKDTWTWDRNRFERLCSFLKTEQDTGSLELCTAMQAFRALKESVN